MHAMKCEKCEYTTLHNVVRLYPTLNCSGQVLMVFAEYRCQQCGHEVQIKTRLT